ncbi:MAG TPA: hypothetical protein VF281_03660 [Candidatus Saccharimonadales bacterium]
MEPLITADDRMMHNAAKLRLLTSPSYNSPKSDEIFLLHFVYALTVNAVRSYQHGCDAVASLVLMLPIQSLSETEAKIRKLISERVPERYDLLVSSEHDMTSVFLEVYPPDLS